MVISDQDGQQQYRLEHQRPDYQLGPEYRCGATVDLYDSPHLTTLATQAAGDRHLRFLTPPQPNATAIPVCLCEDDYPGWISPRSLPSLQPSDTPYQAPVWSAKEIGDRLPQIIAYTQAAMAQGNYYRWGGTVGPSYDCSGLMQAAFRSVGVWIPRDAYLQEPFTQPVPLNQLQPGDLIFFGPPERANHVALYLGEGRYVHSSGKAMGRNGIGIDVLYRAGDDPPMENAISRAYFQQIHGAGRVISSYQPTGTPMRAIAIESSVHG
ncbi:MAG: C40 family peptidase [Leptolyngbyaceae bacterium]|nr:C40 family peptidase [Leptolyngbyaceae bacterium]